MIGLPTYKHHNGSLSVAKTHLGLIGSASVAMPFTLHISGANLLIQSFFLMLLQRRRYLEVI
jgi:hypothetical protein